MDSLTQIVLGAACGEVVLGRKAGNKAMLWGAVGGTIPDLDVMANFFTDEITALAFHRGISHSFFFAFTAPLVFGWLVHRLYRKRRPGETTYRDWVMLFFWAIFTHPLLDSCTTYGTQLFQPFWDYRVALNTISVADPIYTLPFLVLLILAMRQLRDKSRRRWFTWAGIGVSSAYLAFTAVNKLRVDAIFEKSLEGKNIAYTRFTASPTILNNILWQGIAEGDTAFYHGYYSFFDAEPRIDSFTVIPKNHHLLEGMEGQRDVETLQWFSSGYYNLIQRDDGVIQLNDLRFGSMDGTFEAPGDYIFRFELKAENGKVVARQVWERPEGGEMLEGFWRRLRGGEEVRR
ncbi:MAG: metal-dependent hydrolase [Saprospiraceae bacterium]